LHALDFARVFETRIAAYQLVSCPKLVCRVKNNRFILMHVGMRQNYLLQEDAAADAAIECASELLVPRGKPASALHLEEQAENALVEVDRALVDFGQDLRM
jgi:hypothetical protein